MRDVGRIATSAIDDQEGSTPGTIMIILIIQVVVLAIGVLLVELYHRATTQATTRMAFLFCFRLRVVRSSHAISANLVFAAAECGYSWYRVQQQSAQ